MRCPICKTELKVTGQAKLQTLGEHVCDPNGEPSLKDKYQCVNEDCIAMQDELIWNDDGEYYTGKYPVKKYSFINDNFAPFGTFERRMNIEIRKHDEDFTLLNLYFIKLVIEFKYVANENGRILERHPQLRILKRDRVGWILGKVFFKYYRKY